MSLGKFPSTGMNMNYRNLKSYFVKETYNNIPHYPTDTAPVGLSLYNLGNSKRPSIFSLRLTPSHKYRWPQPREVDGELVVSQAYVSKDFTGAIYCAWLESMPNVIMLWLRHPSDGITADIDEARFTKSVSATKVSHFRSSPNDHPDTEGKAHWILIELDKIYLHDIMADVNSVVLEDDEDFDPTGAIASYRKLSSFKEMEALVDAIHHTRTSYAWCNIQKAMGAELMCLMKSAVEDGLNTIPPKIALPIGEWLPAMWLQVIGCPQQVRTGEDLLFLVCKTMLSLTAPTEAVISSALQDLGFRERFASWIAFRIRCNIEQLGDDLRRIAEPVSWNSFLVADGEKVRYTHLRKVEDNQDIEYENDGDGTLLDLKVVESSSELSEMSTKLEPSPVVFEIRDSWYPYDFAHKVFSHIQNELSSLSNRGEKGEYSYFGHCSSERAMIKMSKSGLSPYAGYGNTKSCGRAMYFFKMSQFPQELSFEYLNSTPEKDSDCELSEDEAAARKQFRGFVYAMTRCFNVGGIDSLCPAVLLFRVSHDTIKEFDSVRDQFPLQGADPKAATALKLDGCKIKRIDSKIGTPAINCADITLAITNTVPHNDQRTEKINLLAILSGVVDFSVLPCGVYCGNVSDNSLREKAMPFHTIKNWENDDQFALWKTVAEKDVKEFWRPNIRFAEKEQEGFPRANYSPYILTSMKNEVLKMSAFVKFGENTIDIPEYAFVTTCALKNLLQNAKSCEITFVAPGDNNETSKLKGYESEFCVETKCHDPFTEELIRVKMMQGFEPIHPYWKLRFLASEKRDSGK